MFWHNCREACYLNQESGYREIRTATSKICLYTDIEFTKKLIVMNYSFMIQ